jgi:hypothetical protein
LQGNEHVTLKNIVGIDHAVVVVKDLDAAAANWKSLGFTVSPRGTHSAKMGSGNYTMMLGPDYVFSTRPSTMRRRGRFSPSAATASSASPSPPPTPPWAPRKSAHAATRRSARPISNVR